MNRIQIKARVRRHAKARSLALQFICRGCGIAYIRKIDANVCCGMGSIEESKKGGKNVG